MTWSAHIVTGPFQWSSRKASPTRQA
jgi:hypothetical protein